jgi:NAD(P)-dependent dehydrogenase (short-subunit alcohol dehydrogenase family)
MSQTTLAERAFTLSDQVAFAELTHDSNPVHLNALAARRTQFGQPIVHGVHGLLWALDAAAKEGIALKHFRGLLAHFRKPLLLEERVCAAATRSDSGLVIELKVDRLVVTKITLTANPPRGLEHATSLPEDNPASIRAAPADLTIDEMANRRGVIAYAAPQLANAFPHAERELGVGVLEGLAASTYVVGMECPGLHSIFSRLIAGFGGANSSFLAFDTILADDRARLVKLAIRAPSLTATVDAFARMAPVKSPDMTKVGATVASGEFSGQRALIVGGSRGLGAAAAKIIAAGGGTPTITYARGVTDADEVAADIEAAGGRCNVISYDALAPAMAQLPQSLEFNAVYYFAASPIGRRKLRAFDPDLLHEFMRYHVEGFADLAQAARERFNGRLAIFYPSSAYATAAPKELGEYAAAKRAGEAIAENLMAQLAEVSILIERLPPINTDQNVAVTAAASQDPLEAMLPIARKMHALL